MLRCVEVSLNPIQEICEVGFLQTARFAVTSVATGCPGGAVGISRQHNDPGSGHKISTAWVSYGALCPDHLIPELSYDVLENVSSHASHGYTVYISIQFLLDSSYFSCSTLDSSHVEMGSFPTKKICSPELSTRHAAIDSVPCCRKFRLIVQRCLSFHG